MSDNDNANNDALLDEVKALRAEVVGLREQMTDDANISTRERLTRGFRDSEAEHEAAAKAKRDEEQARREAEAA